MKSNLIKIIIINVCLTLIIILGLDFIYSNYIFKTEKNSSIYENNEQLHHKLKKNFSGISKYGYLEPFVCTNEFSFKIKCNAKTIKNYDIGIIGDSIVQAVGLRYDQTLTGILTKNTDYRIANIGTGSYSPIIYYQRLLNLLNEGLTFEHIVVFIDISDIQDEFFYYKVGHAIKNKLDDIKVYESEEREKNSNFSFKSQIKKLIFDNLKISFSTISLIKRKFFISDPFKIYKNDIPRYAWTYNKSLKNFTKDEINFGINNAKHYMKKIYQLLNSKGIKFSIAVYPLPQQLLYDVENNHQVKIWKNFCENKCYKFYDFNKILYKTMNEMSLKKFFKEYFITYDEHFNYKGNKLLANEFLKINVE